MTKLKATDLFDGLDKENPTPGRKPTFSPNKRLEDLLVQFKKLSETGEIGGYRNSHGRQFTIACRTLKDAAYTREEVEQFVIAAARYQDQNWFKHTFGIFTTALARASPDDSFVLHAEHYDPFHRFGAHNRKKITIYGNLGLETALDMPAGELTIHGNVINIGHQLRNGNITLYGSVSSGCGEEMNNGKISVHGSVSNAGDHMTHGMIEIHGNCQNAGPLYKSGEVHVHGDLEHINEPFNGKLYHKGTLIMKDGKKL